MLRDIGDPELVQSARPERGDDVVREHDRVRFRTPPPFASGEPLKGCSDHQAGNTLAVDRPPEPKAHSAVTRGTP